ncbi:MAG TPA: tRNA-guanine transglycosylase, partial [Chitinophagaceae bacterium]|nr:tRNA-guanine transglycosylase [Chitinophagaceae bacterium]
RNKKWATDFSVIDEGIPCNISNYYSKAYLRHLFVAEEILALQIASIHNLAFYLWLVGEARKHILSNSFSSFKNSMTEILQQRL